MPQLQLNSPPLGRVLRFARHGAPVPEQDGKVALVVVPLRFHIGLSTLAEELERDGVAVNRPAPLDVVGRREAPEGRLIAPFFLKLFVLARIRHRVAWAGAYRRNCCSRAIVRARRRC